MAEADPLQRYRAKRNFSLTPEPGPDGPHAATAAEPALSFVIQKHHATRLHYDFRLEWGGVLLSWAVPKGPSLDPADKRMAVRTEDHPLAYGSFEGTIPPKQYGAGRVIVWDRGRWTPQGDVQAGLAQGKLAFELNGEKLHGRWELVRMHKPGDASGERQEAWLLFKKRDEHARARSEYDIVEALPDSVIAPSAGDADAAGLPGAPFAPLPETLSPQLATLATAVPAQGRWIFENKFDGYRLLARIEAGVPRLFTRGGHDWTDKMPELAQELAALGADSAWLDGEIVAGDFNALQNAFDRGRTQGIDYIVFDLPYFEGHDLRAAPLTARRELLRQWLAQAQTKAPPQRRTAAKGHPHVRFSPALGQGAAQAAERVLREACAAQREGIIAKREDAPYQGTRSTSWLKLKCQRRQEFVIGGYTERGDDASAVGSLILGVYDEGRLRHAGSVGTGWNRAAARALRTQLQPLAADAPPFDDGADSQESKGDKGSKARSAARWPRRQAGQERWVRPKLVAEVNFAEWTPAGHIRHASFVALRTDKPARAIVRERALAPAALEAPLPFPALGAPPAAEVRPAPPPAARQRAAPTLKVSHPDRVIDAASGLTKLDLVQYYDRMAEFILPHLRGRPLALLRAPGGVGEPTFFQKHAGKTGLAGRAGPPGVRERDALADEAPMLELHTHAALLAAAQMNVIEFHTGNSTQRPTTHHPTKPDRMVFDLDPGEGVAWPAIREGAQLVRALLQELGLKAWLKTSGGKGLHVVVPLAARWDYDTVKGFSKAVVQHLARTIPARFVAKSGPANRRGRVFVDYLRNGEGATTVAAFSARARPGLGVSMPVAWEALESLKSAADWTVTNAHEADAVKGADPWAEMKKARQSLTAAMKMLGYSP